TSNVEDKTTQTGNSVALEASTLAEESRAHQVCRQLDCWKAAMTASTLTTFEHTAHAPSRGRLPMIDVAKGIGILLIALGHNRIFSSHYGDAANFLAAFRLPFFFFISGVIFSATNRRVGSIALMRADAWLKPYLMALLAGGLLKVMVGKETVESVLLGIFYGTGFTLGWNVLWF